MLGAGTWVLLNVGLAGLTGAAGVALAAVAAHRVADPSLATAAVFLIVHAAAVIGLSALAGQTALPAGFLASASVMLIAVSLFSGDVTARVMAETRLFPMAAPIGGSLLMLSWLGAGLSAVIGVLKSAG